MTENKFYFKFSFHNCFRTSLHAVPDVTVPDITASVPDVTNVKLLIKKDAWNLKRHAGEKQTMYNVLNTTLCNFN